MRKLVSMLAVCVLAGAAFVSCSSSESSSESTTEAVTVSETTAAAATETSAETAAIAETTTAEKKTTTAKKTAAPETEPETEPVTVDPDSLNGGDLTGSWLLAESALDGVMTFRADGTLDMLFDVSAILDFHGKKVRVYGDAEIDVEFDGKTARADYNGQECFVLERISGETSPDNMNGRYEVTGGFMQETNGGNIIVIDDGCTFISSGDMYTYSTNGNRLTIVMKRDGGNDVEENETYGVDGDTLTIIDASGIVNTMKRK